MSKEISKDQKDLNYGKEFNKINSKGKKDGKSKDFNKNKPTSDGKTKELQFEERASKRQDPFFYAASEQAIKDMASFPFLETLGEKIGTSLDAVPGIIAIGYVPSFGSDEVGAGRIDKSANYKTRAADAYFQYVTQGFTGGVDFEAPDLLMTALAGSSLFTLLNEGARAYGLRNYFLQFNDTYAAKAINALGFNYSDFNKNWADFRSEFNIRIAQVNKTIAIPKGFMINERWQYLASYLFTDTSSPEYSTSFAYVANAFLKYDATTLNTGTSLTYVRRGTFTVESYFNLIDELINALTSDDTRAMFGAIRRVYSPDALLSINSLPEDFTTVLVRNDIVSAALHNASWSGKPVIGFVPNGYYTAGTPNITARKTALYQDEFGSVLSHPSYPVTPVDVTPDYYLDYNDSVILDMYDHLVNPGNILDITVNMQGVTNEILSATSAVNEVRRMYCRSEVIESLTIFQGSSTSTLAKLQGLITSAIAVAPLSHLDSHPLIFMVEPQRNSQKSNVKYYLGEIDKYTTISQDKLEKLHNKCMYQMLALPANNRSISK